MIKTAAMTELKSHQTWVGWNAEKRGEKITKIPKDPHSGRNASSVNPSTWGSASQAWKAHKRHNWSGIGYVFSMSNGIVGIDLDNCVTGTLVLSDFAAQVVQMVGSYTEVSPSGKGLHIFVRGTIERSIANHELGLEIYSEARYFTVTAQHLMGTPVTINESQKALDVLIAQFHGDERQRSVTHTPQNSRPNGDTSPDDIRAALKHIPPQGGYYDWLRVLMAIHDAMPNSEGIAIAEAWSPGYKGEIERKFYSFDQTPKDGVTIGTLFHLAQENGYKAQHQRITPQGANITAQLSQAGRTNRVRFN